MAVGARSYGSVAMVEALSRRFTNNGTYDDLTSIPSKTAVEGWIDQISATLNVALAAAGFSTPVTQADCVSALAAVVAGYTAEMCRYANSTGRFASERAMEAGVDPMKAIRNEITAWVSEQKDGFIALGAEHTSADNRESALSTGVISLSFAEHDDGTSYVE